jgi:hypothetical protein
VERLEHDGNEPMLLRIHNGLPGVPYHARIGAHTLLPLQGESDADFIDRALDVAAELGAPFVIVGGTYRHNRGNGQDYC